MAFLSDSHCLPGTRYSIRWEGHYYSPGYQRVFVKVWAGGEKDGWARVTTGAFVMVGKKGGV